MGCSGSSGNAESSSKAVAQSQATLSDVPTRKVSSESLHSASSGASTRTGKMTVSGRYNRLPKRLEDDYELKKDVLGSGFNGHVLLAYGKGKQKKNRFAVKAFKLSGVDDEKQQILLAELEVFLGVDHPNIVRLVDVYEAEDVLYMVMECMEGGTMFQRLQASKGFSEQDAADITRQMLLAVNYLHKRHVVHRDLKLENFLFASKKTNQIKLIDFGFSRIWMPEDDQQLMTWNVGTLCHAAPEVLRKKYTSQCDLWSLGTIVFMLLSGKEPFSGETVKHTLKAILAGNFSMEGKEWNNVSESGKEFVRCLLTVDPEERLTAEKALQHPWIVQRKDSKAKQPTLLDKATVDGLVNFGQVSTFRRACMMMMALSCSSDENAELHDAFIDIDTDQTGLIKISEFKVVLQEHFDLHDDEVQKAFDAIDQYNDGVIHYSEFLAACMATRVTMCDDTLQAAFKRFDIKQNGIIEADELAQILGSSFSKDEIQGLINDANGSRGDHISYEDFIAYLRSGGSEKSRLATEAIIDKEQKLERKESKERSGSKERAGIGSPAVSASPPLSGSHLGEEHPWKAFSGTFRSHSKVLDSIIKGPSPNCSNHQSKTSVGDGTSVSI